MTTSNHTTPLNLSILMATCRRPAILKQELDSFLSLETTGITWEMVIVDNADDATTKALVTSYADRLPIQYLVEKRPGKNFALNSALPRLKGDLVVFTDDDIIVQQDWLHEILEGAERWPDHSIFGGTLLPYNLDIIPAPFRALKGHRFLFAIADWKMKEGPFAAEKVFGGNMIIRRHLFEAGWCFDQKVSPAGKNYITGGETDLLVRLEKQGFPAIYLPNVAAYHIIRPEQGTWPWILRRAFNGGRGMIHRHPEMGYPMLFGVPRFLFRQWLERLGGWIKCGLLGNRQERLERRYELALISGQIYQYRFIHKNKKGGTS